MAPNWGLLGRCSSQVHEVFVLTLESVDIQISIRGFVAKLTSCITYHNSTDNALEVEYRIPVDESAAVYKFEAVVNDRKITAQCMEKKKAEKVYKEAVASGHTAVLAREDELTADVLHLALGNLPPGTKAVLQLSMVMELKVKTDGAVTFTLPTVLNPRYCPADVTPDQHTQSVANYSSPHVIVVSQSYTFGIQAKVQGGHEIARIISHTDALNVNMSDDAMSAEVSQDGGFTPDHDWNMLLYYNNPYKTHILRETGDRSATGLMKDDLVMINLHPELPQESYSNKNEIIFVIDRSGSMQGENMQSARATLLLFLKSLPIGCYFNIISFGSSYSLLFPKGSEAYTEATLQKAIALQESMEADMGGTEILQPIKEIYSQPPKPGYARQVLLMSDGQVFNVDQVMQLVRRHVHETRMFAVGIGHGASTALINGLARAGRGLSEMVLQQDKLQLKVMGLVKLMLQESVQEVSVNFEVDPPSGIKLVPKVPPVVYGGQHLILYTRVPPAATVKNIKITGAVGNGVLSVGVQGSDIKTVHDEDMTLHRMAARAQINQWQIDEEEDVAEDMIALSVASGVVSRRTALVGVDQDMSPVVAAPPPTPPRMQAIGGVREMLCASSPLIINAQFGVPEMMGGFSLQSRSGYSFQSNSASGRVQQKMLRSSPPLTNYRTCSKRRNLQSNEMNLMAMRCSHSHSQDSLMSESVDSDDVSDDVIEGQGKRELEKELQQNLMTVVNLQKFDGSWTLTDVSKLTSFTLKCLHDANVCKNEVAWATALVLALLEKKYSSDEDQWVLLASKARAYISGCGEDVSALVAAAKLIFTE